MANDIYEYKPGGLAFGFYPSPPYWLAPPNNIQEAERDAPTNPDKRDKAQATVLVVGFQKRTSERLLAMLSRSAMLTVIPRPTKAEKLVAAVAHYKPAVALICEETLDLLSLARITRDHPHTGTIVLSARATPPLRQYAIHDCGVGALWGPTTDFTTVLWTTLIFAYDSDEAIQLRRSHSNSNHLDAPLTELTAAEAVVLELVRAGATLQQIADLRGVSRATINSHVTKIYDKLNVGTREELFKLLDALEREPAPLRTRPSGREALAFVDRERQRPQYDWLEPPLRRFLR